MPLLHYIKIHILYTTIYPRGGVCVGVLNKVFYGQVLPRDPTSHPFKEICSSLDRKGISFVYLPLQDAAPYTHLLKRNKSLKASRYLYVAPTKL